MKGQDLRNLQIDLYKGQIAPIYCLIAEEPFLLSEALSALRSHVLADTPADFNYDSFFASEDKVDRVRDTVETLPMLTSRRLVILREAHLLKDKDWEFLYPLLDKPVESACLVLVASKLDKRKKFFKKLSASARILELKKPYDNQVTPWIEYIAAKQGLKLTHDAVSMVRQFVGANLSEIYNELSKVKDFLGDRTDVSGEDILQVVSKSRVESVFELANAIGRGDRAAALVGLVQLLESGQNEVGALALIARHFRILSILKEGSKMGLSGSRLSTKAGIPHFFLQEYVNQVRHWTDAKLEETMLALRETDRALKSSPVSSHIWLENFVIRTCSAKRKPVAIL